MSTKIYNGFKYNGSLTDAFIDISAMRSEMIQIANVRKKKRIIREVVHTLDGYVAGTIDTCNKTLFPQGFNPNTIFSNKVFEFFREEAQEKVPYDHDYSFSVVLYPINDGITLGTYYTSIDEMTEIFFDEDLIEKYEYYNNTDKPDELSEKEWEERAQLWDLAFYDSFVPNEAGLKMTVCSQRSLLMCQVTRTDVDLYNFPIDTRLHNIIYDLVLAQHWKRENLRKLKVSDYTRIVREKKAYLHNTRHGQEVYNYYYDIYKDKLWDNERIKSLI